MISLLIILTGSFIKMSGQNLLWTALANPDSLQVNAVGFSSGDQQVLSATNCHPAHIRLWNSSNGNLHWDYEVPNNLMCMMGAGISNDSKYLLAVEEMGNILVFDHSQAMPDSINLINMGTTYAFSMDISNHSQKVVVGGSGGQLQVYRIADGLQIFSISAHTSWVTAVQYSNNSSRIASGGNDNKIKIWDSTGMLIYTLNGHTDDITSLRFSESGDTLWSASRDNTLRMWNMLNGSLIQSLVVSNADIHAMDYHSSKKCLVTVSQDQWIRFIHPETFVRIDSFQQAHQTVPLSVSFSQSGSYLVTGTLNGLVTKYTLLNLTNVNENNLQSSMVHCIPNPSFGQFQISSSIDFKAYIVMDMQGRVIAQNDFPKDGQIDLSQLPKGGYTIKLSDNGGNQYLTKILLQ